MPEENTDSILLTIRQMIGPSVSYDVFDPQLIIHINSALARLCQLGVGPIGTPFKITGIYETWNDFWNGVESPIQDEVRQYVSLKVKMIFDTPASSSVIKVIQDQIDTLEWLMREVAVDGY